MNPYLILGILLIILLIVVFFVTYFLNKRTKAPEGCEDLRIGEEGCGGCKNYSCSIKKRLDIKKIEVKKRSYQVLQFFLMEML